MNNKLLAALLAGIVPLSAGYAEVIEDDPVEVVAGDETGVVDIDEGDVVDEEEGEEGVPISADKVGETLEMLKEQAANTTEEDKAVTNKDVEKANEAVAVPEAPREPEVDAPAEGEGKVLTTEEVAAAKEELKDQADPSKYDKTVTEKDVKTENIAAADPNEAVEGVTLTGEDAKAAVDQIAHQAATISEADKAATTESVEEANKALPEMPDAAVPAQPPAAENDPALKAKLDEQAANVTEDDKKVTDSSVEKANAETEPKPEAPVDGKVIDPAVGEAAVAKQQHTDADKAEMDADLAKENAAENNAGTADRPQEDVSGTGTLLPKTPETVAELDKQAPNVKPEDREFTDKSVDKVNEAAKPKEEDAVEGKVIDKAAGEAAVADQKHTADDIAFINAEIAKENAAENNAGTADRPQEDVSGTGKLLPNTPETAAELDKQIPNVTPEDREFTDASVEKVNAAAEPKEEEAVEGTVIDKATGEAAVADQKHTDADIAFIEDGIAKENEPENSVGESTLPKEDVTGEGKVIADKDAAEAALTEQDKHVTEGDKAVTDANLTNTNMKGDEVVEGTKVTDEDSAKASIADQAGKVTDADKLVTDESLAGEVEQPLIDNPQTVPEAGDPDSKPVDGISPDQVAHPDDAVTIEDGEGNVIGSSTAESANVEVVDTVGSPVLPAALWLATDSFDSRRTARTVTNGDVTVWAKASGLSAKAKDVADTTVKGESVRVGATYAVKDAFRVGLDYGYRNMKADNDPLTLKDRRHEVGVSLTQETNDYYVDLSARMGRGELSVESGPLAAEPKTHSVVLSAEAGYRFAVTDVAYVEPQVQVVHQTFKVKDDVVLGSRSFHYDTLKDTTVRVGVKAGVKLTKTQLWSRVDVRQHVQSEGKVTVHQAGFLPAELDASKKGTGVGLSLGAEHHVLPNLAVGLEASVARDKATKRSVDGGLTVRYTF